MRKKIIIASAFALLSPCTVYTMESLSRMIGYLSNKNLTSSSESELLALHHSTDPSRYGRLSIPIQETNKDLQRANAFVNNLSQLRETLLSPNMYPHTRNNIAHAVANDCYHEDFADIATEKNDLPLWKILLSYQTRMQELYKVDIASASCGPSKTPPLWRALSVEIAQLLVEHGRASIPHQVSPDGKTIIHHACRYDRQPALLAYCLKQYPSGVHCKDHHNNTPLLTLCLTGFGMTYAKEYYLKDVREKLTLLKNAGANFSYRNTKYNLSALDILNNEMANMHPDNVTTLTTFAKEIITAMNEQRAAKIMQTKTEECTLCHDLLETDVTILHCLHVFHELCIQQTMRAGYKNCPLCRTVIVPKNESHAYYDSDDDDFHDESSSTNNPPPLPPFGSLNLAAVIAASNPRITPDIS